MIKTASAHNAVNASLNHRIQPGSLLFERTTNIHSRTSSPDKELTHPVVEIQDFSKTFDQLIAVDSISLCVDRGQTLGLIGPNGAGKTTLLRMICTLALPDEGDIHIWATP